MAWSGADRGSGVASWQVQWQQAEYDGTFGAWSQPQVFPAGTLKKTFAGIAREFDTCYRVRGVDAIGNVSAFSPRRCTAVVLDDWDTRVLGRLGPNPRYRGVCGHGHHDNPGSTPP